MPKPTTVQTYLFDLKSWTKPEAKRWLESHRKVTGLVREGHYWHARQIDPDLFDKRSFRTIDISLRMGIKAVVGHLSAGMHHKAR